VLTHTRPWPPPGAGGLDAATALVFFAGALLTAAGLAAAEVFGLNKSPSENLEGDGDGLVAAGAFLRVPFGLGVAAGDPAGDAAGLAAVVASAFLRLRFGFGAPAGDSAGAGEAVVSLVAAVVSAFLRPRCFAGDSPGVGD